MSATAVWPHQLMYGCVSIWWMPPLHRNLEMDTNGLCSGVFLPLCPKISMCIETKCQEWQFRSLVKSTCIKLPARANLSRTRLCTIGYEAEKWAPEWPCSSARSTVSSIYIASITLESDEQFGMHVLKIIPVAIQNLLESTLCTTSLKAVVMKSMRRFEHANRTQCPRHPHKD